MDGRTLSQLLSWPRHPISKITLVGNPGTAPLIEVGGMVVADGAGSARAELVTASLRELEMACSLGNQNPISRTGMSDSARGPSVGLLRIGRSG